ncbi:MAG: electron transfer flavoprotein subunit alpha/FixB family protein [Vicinamibacterales bacterium]
MILVVAEHKDGTLNRASLESIVAAQGLNADIKVLVLGASGERVAAEIAPAAVAEVLVASDGRLDAYTADAFVEATRAVIAAETPALVLLPHTYQTRDFAPRLAARLERPLVTDCTGVGGTDAAPVLTRSMFQGKLSADVVPVGAAPTFATVQIGAFRADALRRGASSAPVRTVAVSLDGVRIRQEPEAPFKEAKQAVDLTQAERIVSIGRGIKSQEHIAMAERLAKALGAELSASRPICDNGWLPMDRQIGSSGQTVAPKLYMALGISGAIQHLVGMKGSRTIVAVNKDAEAPIFEVADYGIVGDLFEVVPAMIAELEK